jgi:SulP family sulfate permease
MIPESLSFALVHPLVGLYAAFIMGLVTAIFVDLNGLWSRATVIVLALMKSNGLEYVFAAVALAGVIQILIGLFKLGKSYAT